MNSYVRSHLVAPFWSTCLMENQRATDIVMIGMHGGAGSRTTLTVESKKCA